MVTIHLIELIGSEALRAASLLREVHRLNGDGWSVKLCLRYSRTLPRGSLQEEPVRIHWGEPAGGAVIVQLAQARHGPQSPATRSNRSLREGKESNNDGPSNGERTGQSPI
jgi:hypothetical protein